MQDTHVPGTSEEITWVAGNNLPSEDQRTELVSINAQQTETEMEKIEKHSLYKNNNKTCMKFSESTSGQEKRTTCHATSHLFLKAPHLSDVPIKMQICNEIDSRKETP